MGDFPDESLGQSFSAPVVLDGFLRRGLSYAARFTFVHVARCAAAEIVRFGLAVLFAHASIVRDVD